METTMTLETTSTEFVDAAGTCFADPGAVPRRSAVGGLAMVGIEDVFIKEKGRENEMTSTSPDQTKTLVLKAVDLPFNKHDYDVRRTLPVEEAYPAQQSISRWETCPMTLSGKNIVTKHSDQRTHNRGHFVLGLVTAALIVACAIVSSSVIARADPLGVAAKPWPAPIGHAQPRANDFSPSSPAEQAVQDQLSAFDAQQKKLDEMLDKKLNICRC
jgi:hypothetical protein